MNRATMNILVHVFQGTQFMHLFRSLPGTGMTGSESMCIT